MIFLLIIFLLLTNVTTIYILKRKKIRGFFIKSKIKSVNLEKLDKIFENEKVSENLYRPKDETIVRSFCTNLGENDVIGKTSDYEAWIISSLSKKSKNIFEFGTCSGKTTTLMAINSPVDAKIVTLTINVNQAQNLDLDVSDNKTSIRNIVNESQYQKFIFTGKKYENKIEVKFLDSRKLDTLPYRNKFDLIFIDGGHTYSLVKNDTEKAFEMIKKGGIVLWHDYNPLKKSCKDVVKLINEFSEKQKVFHLENTSLCFSIAN